MSFVKARQRSAEAPATTESFSSRCAANGCHLPGTIAPSGGRFVCSYHYAAQPGHWPQVTATLQEHEKVLLAISECIRMGEIEWAMGGWQMMDRYFDDQPELQPTKAERDHKRWFEYRLHNWLMYLAGISSKRPVPRETLPPVKRRGNMSNFIAA